MDSPVRRMLDTKYTRIQSASDILGPLARIKTSKARIDYRAVASLSGVRVNIASLPCLESAHCHPIVTPLSLQCWPNVGPLTGGSHIIGGNARTPPLTPTWPCRCPTCWENANLSGVSSECSAYFSSAVSPEWCRYSGCLVLKLELKPV